MPTISHTRDNNKGIVLITLNISILNNIYIFVDELFLLPELSGKGVVWTNENCLWAPTFFSSLKKNVYFEV